nr:MAG TPA: hypothetical protein [Bacteriophage sp.]
MDSPGDNQVNISYFWLYTCIIELLLFIRLSCVRLVL